MDRRVFRSVLALFLAVTLLVGTSSAALAKGPDKVNGSRFSSNFADWDRGHWANESLARMIVKGVLKGASGTYGLNVQPNRPVTRLEAAIMLVRLMGLDRERPEEIFPIPDLSADPKGGHEYQFRTREGWNVELEYKDGKLEYKFDFEDDEEIPFWGRDAVAIALEKGFLVFEGRKMNPNTPLKRVEAAIMLVKAAGLEAEAKAQAGAALPFKDAAAISYTAKGYVAVAIEEGLITGMPDGTFQPEKPVTRAQWAAMLDRFDRRHSDDANQVKGTITAINLSAAGLPTISMTTPVFPGGVTYTVADEAVFFIDGQEASISALHVGDEVLVQLDENRHITMITVVKQPGTTLAGTVVAFTAPVTTQNGAIILQGTTGTGQAYAVAPDAAVRLGVVSGSFADVREGDRVTLTLVGGVVKVITVDVATQTVQGTVMSKSTTTLTAGSILTVSTAGGATTTYRVADNVTVVSAAGASLAFSDVKVGDVVELQLQRDVIVRIKIVRTAAETVSGTLSAITIGSAATPSNITLTTASGSRSFQVAANATVTYSGQSLAIADLRVGDKLTVTAQNNIVTAVVITQRTADALFVEGQVSNLNPTARTFTLTASGGTYTVYWNTTTAFTLQGQTSSAGALANGQTVRAFGTTSGTLIFASKVEIRTTQTTVSGTVSSLTDNGGTTPDVLVITSGSTTSMYQVASTVPVTWSGVRITFGDLAVGDTVTLTLTNNLVSAIQVTGRQTQAVELTGQISNLDLTGKALTLTVPGTSGSTAYSVRWNDQTAFTYQGNLVIASSQLANGQQVKVTGTAAGTLISASKVDVQVSQSSLTGTVTALVSPTTSNPGAITVVSNGVTHSYQVRNTARVSWQGLQIAFSDLAVGDGVKLTLSNAEVTAVELTTRQMSAVSLTGRISNLDTQANTLTLTVQATETSGQTVTQVYTVGYTDQTVITYPGLSNVSEVSLANGQTLVVTGSNVGQVMSATRLDIQVAAQ